MWKDQRFTLNKLQFTVYEAYVSVTMFYTFVPSEYTVARGLTRLCKDGNVRFTTSLLRRNHDGNNCNFKIKKTLIYNSHIFSEKNFKGYFVNRELPSFVCRVTLIYASFPLTRYIPLEYRIKYVRFPRHLNILTWQLSALYKGIKMDSIKSCVKTLKWLHLKSYIIPILNDTVKMLVFRYSWIKEYLMFVYKYIMLCNQPSTCINLKMHDLPQYNSNVVIYI